MASYKKPKTALKFNKPSGWWGALWRTGLPTGNGIIGASVLGGAARETVMLNHSDLWWQGYTGVLQDVADKLKEVRKNMDEGNYEKAAEILPNALINKGYRPTPAVPLPLCDFKVNIPIEKPVKEYLRMLNMENGEITVSYKDGATKYERSLFVSSSINAIAYEFTKSGPKFIDAEFSFDMHDRTNVRTPNAVSKLPDGLMTKYENYFMYISMRSDSGREFGAVAKITYYGGSMEVGPNSIKIKGAERIFIIIKPFVESQREKEWKALKTELAGIKLTYDKLLKEHSAKFDKAFGAMDFDLAADDREAYIEDLLDRAITSGEVKPALIEKLWAFGRYIFVSASTNVSKPIAPYGLWCGDYKAFKSYIDGYELPLVYSQALSGNIADYLLPLFNYYEQVVDDLKKNASRLYGCRGIFIPRVVAPQSGLIGIVDAKTIHTICVGGMVARLFYDYYLFTGDLKFLKERALPFMAQVALFYEEFLKIKTDGTYDFNPSYVPDNQPSNHAGEYNTLDIARNTTLDFAVLKDLLNNLIEGSQKASVYKDEIEKWRDMLTRIPPYVKNKEGLIKEYNEIRMADNNDTRSTGLFYPFFPSTEAMTMTDCEIFDSFYATAKKRIIAGVSKHNAYSYAYLANVFARMRSGEDALECIENIIKTSLMPNLVTASNDWRGMGIGDDDFWASYYINGNIGITSAIQEMIVASSASLIEIFPALPESWKKGSLDGALTRTGAEVSVDWDKKKGIINLKIKAKRASTFDILLPHNVKRIKGVGAENFNPETRTISDVNLGANKSIAFEIRL